MSTCSFVIFFYLLLGLVLAFHPHRTIFSRERRLHGMTNEEIQELVSQRAFHRSKEEYDEADIVKAILDAEGVVVTDIPHKQGGGSTWTRSLDKRSATPEWMISGRKYTSLMQVAHECYDLKESSQINEIELLHIAKYFLSFSMDDGPCDNYSDEPNTEGDEIVTLFAATREMQGRKFADAAFEFGLAGLLGSELSASLVYGAKQELQRWGHRQSCRAVDICQVVEKLACAGIHDQELFSLAADILETKGWAPKMIAELRFGEFSLLSDRPLLSLWRFAAKQGKHGKQVYEPQRHLQEQGSPAEAKISAELSQSDNAMRKTTCETASAAPSHPPPMLHDVFHDSSLPLIVDLGCGFGVSLLGLAQSTSTAGCGYTYTDSSGDAGIYKATESVRTTATSSLDTDSNRPVLLSPFNFLGCDMSSRAVNFASSISRRWGMSSFCQFVECDVLQLLLAIKEQYGGEVVWINVNFPTPYKFDLIDKEGNPVSSVDSDRIIQPRHHPAATAATSAVAAAAATATTTTTNSVTADTTATSQDKGNLLNDIERALQVEGQREVSFESVLMDHAVDTLTEQPWLGNRQLPSCISDFMVTEETIELCRDLLSRRGPGCSEGRGGTAEVTSTYSSSSTSDSRNSSSSSSSGGGSSSSSSSSSGSSHISASGRDISSTPGVEFPRCLMMQSNVEDVAIAMRAMVERSSSFGRHGGLCVPATSIEALSLWDVLLATSDPRQHHILEAELRPHSETAHSRKRDFSTSSAVPAAPSSPSSPSLAVDASTDEQHSKKLPHSSTEGLTDSTTAAVRSTLVTLLDVGEASSDALVPDAEGTMEGGLPGQGQMLPQWAAATAATTRRQKQWVEAGGVRAAGLGFLPYSPLPLKGRTETEVACAHEGKPVHRLIFVVRKP